MALLYFNDLVKAERIVLAYDFTDLLVEMGSSLGKDRISHPLEI